MTNPETPTDDVYVTGDFLKPCPLCGEKTIYMKEGKSGGINCPACLVRLPNECNDTGEMLSCWNNRAEPQSDALKAIEFALTIDDHFEMRDFLYGWMHGDTSEWPEYGSAPLSLNPNSRIPESSVSTEPKFPQGEEVNDAD